MNNHLRTNGLIAGKIPPNQPCPFLRKCIVENDNCPSLNNLKQLSFDCGAARMQSLIIEKFAVQSILQEIIHD